jgi:hypothetical protein
MIGKKYDKFFYFRRVSSGGIYNHLMLPVAKITGIMPTGRTKVRFRFPASVITTSISKYSHGFVDLNITQDTSKEVIKAIIDATNATPADGVIVIADDITLEYIHKDIDSISSIHNQI